jgi:hypothetical protein
MGRYVEIINRDFESEISETDFYREVGIVCAMHLSSFGYCEVEGRSDLSKAVNREFANMNYKSTVSPEILKLVRGFGIRGISSMNYEKLATTIAIESAILPDKVESIFHNVLTLPNNINSKESILSF